jgi:hypothetical protein
MKKQRFQVGDKVTYKDIHELPNEKYFYGGTNQKGYVGTITSYEWFIEERNCYRIQVSTSITNGYFSMLESEFEEYDVVQKEPGSKFNIGDVVNITGEGYMYSGMDTSAHNRIFDWEVITNCNCRPPFRSNIVVKDKVYSSVQDKWWYKFDEFCGNWTSECGIVNSSPVVNPMDAILEEAIRKYPVGTKYIPIRLILNGSVYIREEKVVYTPRITGSAAIEGGIGYLYVQGKWAEVVSETESVFKGVPPIQSGSSLISSGTIYSTNGFLGSVTTPTIATIGTSSWGYTDSGFSISSCSEIPKSIQNTMPDEDIVHRENTIKAMQL